MSDLLFVFGIGVRMQEAHGNGLDRFTFERLDDILQIILANGR